MVVREEGVRFLFVLREKLLLQENIIINLDHCFFVVVLISCYYSHNRSTSEEGNVKNHVLNFIIRLYKCCIITERRYRM